MTRYQVDSEEILNATGAARGTIGRLQTEVANLYGQLTALEASWTGPAATAFSTAAREWKATQQLVEENLGALSQALGHAGQQYAEIENTNARLFVR